MKTALRYVFRGTAVKFKRPLQADGCAQKIVLLKIFFIKPTGGNSRPFVLRRKNAA